MKRIIQCSVITLLPLIVGIAAYAKEGFFLKHTLPSQLIPAWEATFFIEYQNGSRATAFVIEKQIVTSRRARLLFLTSDHLVQGNCKKAFGHCPNIAKVSASEGTNRDNGNPILLDNRDWTIHDVEVVDRNVDNDIALLQAIVDRNKYESLQPIPFVSNCKSFFVDQEMYTIGFPYVGSRTAPDALPLKNKDHLIRRWSHGLISARIRNSAHREEDQKRFYWVGTTADALPGNSGGPALTAAGEFFGVTHGIQDLGDQNPYLGDDPDANWHSYFTNCYAIADFLSR